MTDEAQAQEKRCVEAYGAAWPKIKALLAEMERIRAQLRPNLPPKRVSE